MMLGYILVEDIFDEMSQNISYIKLNCYLKEGRKVLCQIVWVNKNSL